MSINISPNIPANVVEIGNEITQNVIDALANASSPSSANPLLTASAGNAAYAGKNALNVFTANQVVSVNTTSTAFRVTQVGTGASFVVEDSGNPDNTPFVIDNSGRVGIQTPSASLGTNALTVTGTIQATGSVHSPVRTNAGTGDADFSATSTSGRARFLATGGGEALVYLVAPTAYVQLNSANAQVIVGDGVNKTKVTNLGVFFNDDTAITSGPVPKTATAIASGSGSGNEITLYDYPDEIEFRFGPSTFRVPARSI
jgi:hypothetical protein